MVDIFGGNRAARTAAIAELEAAKLSHEVARRAVTAAVATGNVCLKAYAAGSWTPTGAVTATPTRVPSGGGGGGCSGLGFAPLAVLILLPLLALKRR